MGEGDAIAGWLAYGAALNEGRVLFSNDDDYNFGKWVSENVSSKLEESFIPHPADQSAAMWAAANPEQFEEAPAVPIGTSGSLDGTISGSSTGSVVPFGTGVGAGSRLMVATPTPTTLAIAR